MFDPDGIGPKIRALYNTFLNWTVTTADLLLTRVDATISSAVTAAQAAEAAALAGGDQPPIAGGIVGPAIANADLVTMPSVDRPHMGVELTAVCDTFDVWVDLVNYTGSGVLEFAAIYQIDNVANLNAQIEMLIDGLSVYLSNSALFQTSTDDSTGVAVVGLNNNDGLAMGRVQFNTSLQIRAKKTENAAGTVNIGARVRYQKWS